MICKAAWQTFSVDISNVYKVYAKLSRMIRGCSIVCPNNTHDPIPLPHDTAVTIGRSTDTRCIDPRCSRKQLEIKADWNKEIVTVKQLGNNSSAIDGIELEKDRQCTLSKGSILYLLVGQYPQKVEFVKDESNDSTESTKSSSKKSDTNSLKSRTASVESGKGVKNDSKEGKGSKGNNKEGKNLKSNDDSTSSLKGSKKRTAPEDSANEKSTKKPRLSENSSPVKEKATSSKSHSKNEKNKLDTRSDVKSDKVCHDNESDEENSIKILEEKLKKLKKSAAEKKFKFSDSEENLKDNKHVSPMKKKKGDNEYDSPSPESSKESVGIPGLLSVGLPVEETSWEQFEKLYVCKMKGVQARDKIAGFDIDGTIITTQSGKVFPTHVGDWKFLLPEIPGRLKKLHQDGYKIVFFTNQLGVAKGKTKIEDLKKKFTAIVAKIGVPVQILISTGGGIYRKPARGMWDFLQKSGNDDIKILKERSFYVGDAAGRPDKWTGKRKKDFSCSDRLFAMNVNVQFYTPEEYFQCQKPAPFSVPEFDPRKIDTNKTLLEPPDAKVTSSKREVVVLVGYPACGKSFFTKTYMVPKGYVHINRDTLGSWQKCVSACDKALREGQSVVIDNTNPDVESRARYVQCAKKASVRCRCFVFNATHTQARHNERFREMIDKSHQPINDMIMNSMKSKYKEPKEEEGFSAIVKVNFVPKFENTKHERLYKQFLLEK